MDKSVLFGIGTALVSFLLPYAVKSMPTSISMSGVALGVVIIGTALLPDRLQPTLFQVSAYAVSVAIFVATLVSQLSNLEDDIKPRTILKDSTGAHKMDQSDDRPTKSNGIIVGTDINNSGGGVGMMVDSHSNGTVPSVGAESVVHVEAGQSAIGTRVVQSGPGVGLVVRQTGPGVGYRSVVIVGSPGNEKK
ncbi:hypothetical protein [Allorhizobium taibaishanense]|uniref:Uncharacterized protein n=1 Tax=Allorhizobium taibaishanense TaxID=887144 RepID=A0A7W6MTI8_9HYPH|nr:hypothetical protein [Allorhizobium taibaishanense]MBB4007113.1 hypothetical protein [Allorhizobium taibaishanense]